MFEDSLCIISTIEKGIQQKQKGHTLSNIKKNLLTKMLHIFISRLPVQQRIVLGNYNKVNNMVLFLGL